VGAQYLAAIACDSWLCTFCSDSRSCPDCMENCAGPARAATALPPGRPPSHRTPPPAGSPLRSAYSERDQMRHRRVERIGRVRDPVVRPVDGERSSEVVGPDGKERAFREVAQASAIEHFHHAADTDSG
jgi:hypothetical protein